MRRRIRMRRWLAAWLGTWTLVAVGCVTPTEQDNWEADAPEETGLSEAVVYDESRWRAAPDVTLPESAHPYANNADETVVVTLPDCVEAVRLVFSRIEMRGADSLSIYDAMGRRVQRITGSRENFVSNAVQGMSVTLRLRSNRSTRGFGYQVSRIEVVEQPPICSRMAWRSCDADEVTLAPDALGVCQCPQQPVCAPLAEFEASYGAGGGFTGGYGGRTITGDGRILSVHQMTAGDPVETRLIGFVNPLRLQNLANEVQNSRFLTSSQSNFPGNMTSTFVARQGTAQNQRFWPTGEVPPADMENLVTQFNKALTCGTDADSGRCAPGYRCQEGVCVEAVCSCGEIFQPVCGVLGNFYENPCMAECYGEEIRHSGWCGMEGDECGGLRGLDCAEHYRCQYTDGTSTPANAVETGICVSMEPPTCDCPAEDAPVCTVNDATYPNRCQATCDGQEVRHDGACGIEGDTCGTIRGLGCQAGFQCHYEGGGFEPPYPDAGGVCLAEMSCVCPRHWDPWCGDNWVTYGNTCMAACAGVNLLHQGECGMEGDSCGGRRGLTCLEGYRCQYTDGSWDVTYPDEVGQCMPQPGNWCDTPTECGMTVRLSCPANWFCENHQCRYECIPVENWTLESVVFETSHPYRNDQRFGWTATGEDNTLAIRFVFESFSLEEGYDFVILYDEGWNEITRYTGELGAFTTAEVPGRIAHLVFKSDASVVQQGFVGTGVEYKSH